MVPTTQTLPQIKSQELNGHIKQHFVTTSPLTYVTNGILGFAICSIIGWVHLDNMQFGGLKPGGLLI